MHKLTFFKDLYLEVLRDLKKEKTIEWDRKFFNDYNYKGFSISLNLDKKNYHLSIHNLTYNKYKNNKTKNNIYISLEWEILIRIFETIEKII